MNTYKRHRLSPNIISYNYIQTEQPENWEDETIRREVIDGMNLLAAVTNSIYTSSPAACMECDIEDMVQFFLEFRNYGVFGKGAGPVEETSAPDIPPGS